MCIRDRLHIAFQVMNGADGVADAAGGMRATLQGLIHGHFNIAAVSYTHLDVYKRQALILKPASSLG